MICTIYAHNCGLQNIIDLLISQFPKAQISRTQQDDFEIVEATVKGGIFSKDNRVKISYRERQKPDYQLDQTSNCSLSANLKGLHGFVNALPAKNQKIKSLFLQKIQTLNCEFSIIQESGKSKNIVKFIKILAQQMDAILFVQPNTIISKASGQHFLNKDLNLILDQEGNCQIDNMEVKIDSKYFDVQSNEPNQDQKLRKNKSEAFLEQYEIKINRNLPVIQSEADCETRSPQKIAERVCILAFTNLVAFDHMTSIQAKSVLRKFNLDSKLTPKEQSFLEDPTPERKSHETWKCEDIWVLLWALNLVPELGFPNVMADLNNVPENLYPIASDRDPNDFINETFQPRSKSEILDANDLYYRMDWACVDARLKNQPESKIIPGVVYERHYALNWLINYQDSEWDDVSCDT